jgi:hypothetical protein
MYSDLCCEKLKHILLVFITTGTFNLLSKILTALRLSGAVWIEVADWLPLSSNLIASESTHQYREKSFKERPAFA